MGVWLPVTLTPPLGASSEKPRAEKYYSESDFLSKNGVTFFDSI